MDYEVELAAVIGKPLPKHQKLTASDADEHIFGFLVLNDWSGKHESQSAMKSAPITFFVLARDIQALEMPPLGPFNGKSFGTTISPWIVTMDALDACRVSGKPKDGHCANYIQDSTSSTFDITLEVEIITGSSSTKIATSNVQTLYWSPRQMIAHAASSGSGLRTGDVIATGTVSGPKTGTYGCLLEETEGGAKPLTLEDGSQRTYLEDGDIVRITAFAGRPEAGVGFGDCVGRIVAHELEI
ncbi:Fumarylacetoacetase [Paramyrothecium foliicola]|nr:Fumarylacetoacetase [Paramyrothecium foliicola]